MNEAGEVFTCLCILGGCDLVIGHVRMAVVFKTISIL